MKLRVVHDEDGLIVAAVALDDEQDGMVPVPVPGPGQVALDLEIQGEHRGEDLATLCTEHRVDPSRGVLTPRGDAASE